MLTPDQMDARLDEHFGFEARDDVEGVLSTLTLDVEHDIVGWPHGPSRGPAEARAFYESLFADLADGRVRSVRRLYGDNFMVDESIWTGRAVGRPSRSTLLTNVMIGTERRRQTSKSFLVCGSMPLAASMTMIAESTAVSVR